MAIEHHFYIDTAAGRHELCDALVRAGIGFEVDLDWENTSGVSSVATNVVIRDALRDGEGRLDNGVMATCSVMFRDRKAYLSNPELEGQFEVQTVLGIMVLLKAYPEADAYWLAYDAERPMLLRQGGRLVLSQAQSELKRHWDAKHQSFCALIDLPYTVEPLGPWNYVPIKVRG